MVLNNISELLLYSGNTSIYKIYLMILRFIINLNNTDMNSMINL